MAANNRQSGYPASSAYKGQNMTNAYAQPGHAQNMAQHPRGAHFPASDSLHALTGAFTAMNIHASYPSSGTTKSAGSIMSGNSSEYGSMQMAQGQGLWLPNQHVIGYPVMAAGAQQQAGMTHSPGMYNHAGQFVPQPSYQYGHAMMENSPMAAPNWASRVSSGDMPSLMTPRRDSISSNENDIPGTPYTNGGVYRYGASAAIMDRSPSAVYANSGTPSPSQLAHQYQLVGPLQKQHAMPTLSPHLQALLVQEPSIPRAIPAPSSPLKPLDRSLENKTGETNVYIRGLLPETDDEMLHSWGKRFGDIQSSKSIIDLKTNLCKGYVCLVSRILLANCLSASVS